MTNGRRTPMTDLSPELQREIRRVIFGNPNYNIHTNRHEYEGWFIYRSPTIGPEPRVLRVRRRNAEGQLLKEITIR